MKFRIGRLVIALLVVSSLFCARGGADETVKGPTPYPTNDKDWPGKGPIRKFGWMDDNRKYFWSQRAKDQGAIVFAGDSLTGNWKDLAKDLGSWKVANRGIGGDTSRGLLFRFQEDVLDLNPKAVVLLIGTNDLTALGKPADAAFNISQMLDMIGKRDPSLPVVLCTTPPSDNPKAPVKLEQRQAITPKSGNWPMSTRTLCSATSTRQWLMTTVHQNWKTSARISFILPRPDMTIGRRCLPRFSRSCTAGTEMM